MTFPTRKEAERAIALSGAIRIEGNHVEVAFDRGIPGYFYCDKLIGEAFFTELAQIKPDQGFTKLKQNIILKHHEENFKNYFFKHLSNLSYFYGSDEEADPLVKDILDSYEENSEFRESIANQQQYGFERRDQKLRNRNYSPKEILSSDDEFLVLKEEVEVKEKLDRGRLSNPNHPLTQRLVDKYFLSPKQLPSNAQEVEEMFEGHEKFTPRQVPPKTLWANLAEKDEIGSKIIELEKFFFDAIPSEVKQNQELLSKARFSDYPEIRYVYKPRFNYSDIPTPKDKSKDIKREAVKREMLQNLRDWYQNKPSEESKLPPRMLFGEEENMLLELKKSQEIFTHTDSDEEALAQATIKANVDTDKDPEDIITNMRNSFAEVEGFLSEIAAKSDVQYTKSYVYDNKDIEDHIKAITSQYPTLKVTHSKNKFDQNVVLISYAKTFKVNLADVERMYDKYFNQVQNNPNLEELEIEEEDLETINKLDSLDFSFEEIHEDMLTQMAEKHVQKYMADDTNLEDVKKWGAIVETLREDLERKHDTGDTPYYKNQ